MNNHFLSSGFLICFHWHVLNTGFHKPVPTAVIEDIKKQQLIKRSNTEQQIFVNE